MEAENDLFVVSAPGKVLITGGYLVLDQKYSGFVQATSSRFICIVKKSLDQTKNEKYATIRAISPQFIQGQWVYHWNKESKTLEESKDNTSKNFYIQCTIQNTLLLASNYPMFNELLKDNIDIIIMGHNDFYSQREQLKKLNLPRNFKSIASIPSFCPADCEIKDVNKTGLGSSAAMITSLVAALLGFFKVIELPNGSSESGEFDKYNLNFLHNVAQYCHCLAQGKVGSGFDVSAAVWGSHVYRRFNPNLINDLYKLDSKEFTIEKLINVLDPKKNKNWDSIVKPCHLPPGLTMRLADISAGSSTPKMVSQVNAWKKQNVEEANELWNNLDKCNNKISSLFEELTELCSQEKKMYWRTLEELKKISSDKWTSFKDNGNLSSKAISVLLNIKETFLSIRNYLRIMSEKTKTPIEPELQTRLLNACMECPGVLMAGVPGAGGFDAIFCIIIEGENDVANCSGIKAIEELWQNWNETSVCPLMARQSNHGICHEQSEQYLKYIKNLQLN